MAITRGWKIRQLDVNNAFLNGVLEEEVYMTQPPGFEDTTQPNLVCKLHKALYGLKQAPRAWFERLHQCLLSFGFTSSKSNHSLFILQNVSSITLILVYVADILVTGSDPKTVTSLIDSLSRTFSLKDLGELKYFLGIEVAETTRGLTLSQIKCATDLLSRADMTDAKPISTPMVHCWSLTVFDYN
ncbi:hypothetical protein CsatB_005014 [Cannabis sativa]